MAFTEEERRQFIIPKSSQTSMVFKLKTPPEESHFALFDVKFCPYDIPDSNDDAIFAIIGQKKIYIGLLSWNQENLVTMGHELIDIQEMGFESSAGLNSCSWCYIEPSEPLLAVTGGSGQLKVFNAITGQLFAAMTGHGQGTINDLATHPLYPWILATASMDKTIRIWDLRRWSEAKLSPTVIICGQGTGHCEGILTVAWHATGRYLISGGHDHRVCVWTIPDLADESDFWGTISPAGRKRSSDEVLTIHFPHFISSAVHNNFVDCVKFFNDLVISKASEEDKVVLWKITGFNSRLTPPTSVTAPKTQDHLDTRNGFMRTVLQGRDGTSKVEIAPQYTESAPYERLLEFGSPDTQSFYMRFGLLMPSALHPELHPILSIGNQKSQLRIWDLTRLALGHAAGLDESKADKWQQKVKNPLQLLRTPDSPMRGRQHDKDSSMSRQSSIGSTTVRQGSMTTDATSLNSDPMMHGLPLNPSTRNRQRYPIENPYKPLQEHAKIHLGDLELKKGVGFVSRAVDWSPCGRWCIVVGESSEMNRGNNALRGSGAFAVLERWDT